MGSNEAKEFSISKIMEENQGRGCFFEIPPYQRLYEWEEEQIKTLLEDVKKAQEEQKDIYFIGNVVVSQQNGKYILIDGQQRLTTLFLIGVYLASKEEDKNGQWGKFVKNGKQIRISMPLRENEEQWLSDFIGKEKKESKDFEKLSEKNPNIHHKITEGLEIIAKWFKNNEGILENFSKFLYGTKAQDPHKEARVRFALVELTKDTDLNQFFVRMNNRGKQLEKHEILKSRLLDIIRGQEGKDNNNSEWQKYAKIWDLCSDMDKYLFALEEDRKMFGLQRQEGSEIVIKSLQDTCDKKPFHITWEFKDNINVINVNKDNGDDISGATLANIIEKSKPQKNEKKSKDAIYRSIIDFPTFLLHIFKLFALKNNQGFDVPIKKDDLLKTMWDDRDEAKFWNEDNVRAFIQQLLLYRFVFDYFVIKQKVSDSSYVIDWSYIEDEKSSRKLFGIKNDDDDLKNLVMIQNYLRVARAGEKQNYHHWLTYMLKETYCILFDDGKGFLPILVNNLEELDTDLAIGQISKRKNYEDGLLEITKQRLVSSEKGEFNKGFDILVENLNQGTEAPHYWFYRLEYYLWKWRGSKEKLQWEDKKLEDFQKIANKYRFRGLNSIEHIQPQSKKEEWEKWENIDQNEICKIDDFGNLALISQSFNSSLNNQSMEKKWVDIKNKEDVESLKMCLAYASVEGEYQNWNPTTAKKHQTKMLKILKASLESKGQK